MSWCPDFEWRGAYAWSGTPIRDTGCCFHPLNGVPYLLFGPCRAPRVKLLR